MPDHLKLPEGVDIARAEDIYEVECRKGAGPVPMQVAIESVQPAIEAAAVERERERLRKFVDRACDKCDNAGWHRKRGEDADARMWDSYADALSAALDQKVDGG